jgi:hypothetical protein
LRERLQSLINPSENPEKKASKNADFWGFFVPHDYPGKGTLGQLV